jgi:hypothetical protein
MLWAMTSGPAAPIGIRGGGIAALCCRKLLGGQGVLLGSDEPRPRLPAVLVSPSTQNLLTDVFQALDLFAGFPLIRKRVVAWGRGEALELPHSGVVASEESILERLRSRMPGENDGRAAEAGDPAWSIVSAAPIAVASTEMGFGSRRATVSEVQLGTAVERDTCWVESAEEGWLFLLATSDGVGSLITVGGPAERLFEQSGLVARQVQSVKSATAEFAAYPRILAELCGEGWLACGSAAMSFDPLCGEGAGNAVREAILACAAVRAILGGEPEKDVLEEYRLRLTLGFLRHLENCREFYAGRANSAFWTAEFAQIERGILWTQSRLAATANPRYRLVGFELERARPEG